MKATEAKLLDFIQKSTQFIIPIYQRTYSWNEQECKQLWDDIIRTGKEEKIPAHFIGSIVYIEKGLYQVSSQSPLLVIDGQQRITTILLIIEALARHVDSKEPLEGVSAKQLRRYYLLNPGEEEDRFYKLLLTQTDKDSLIALLDQKPFPKEPSMRIKQNFEFFLKKIQELDDINILYKGLLKLIIVDIALNRDQNKPQLIFESMNSTGCELSQADLIRNFILMDLEPKHQTKLYEKHWRPMEVTFGQKAYSDDFDSFIRDYLTMKTNSIPKIKNVYKEFKQYVHEENNKIDVLVADIHIFADYYCKIALCQETDRNLKTAFKDLQELKVNVSYPFLLQVYHDYKNNLLSVKDFESVIRLVESYVFRRAICNMPTNSLNKTFAKFSRSIKKGCYLESIKAYFLIQSSYRKFPTDDEFFRGIQSRNCYAFRNCSYLFRKLENGSRRKELLESLNEYTIEHILPQNENLSQEWQQALGSDWKEIQDKYLHTLGNLTLTGYNSEYKDRPFKEKQTMKGGFKESPLHLNEGLRDITHWGENEIKTRAAKLAKKAIQIWPAPVLSLEVLNSYRSKEQLQGQSSYSINHYSHLAKPNIRELFDHFRKAVLALDSNIKEECKKFYIAYKAEGNFVCVNPQAKKLRLSLGLKIHELHDPKNIGTDISYIGRVGTGDVEVSLHSSEDLPYIIGMVRQALEKQIGSGGV